MDSVWDQFRSGQQAALAPQAAMLQQAAGGISLAQHLQDMKNQADLRGALASGDPAALARVPGGLAELLKQVQVKKAQSDAAMGEQFSGMDLAKATPDQIRAIGVRAGLGGHPGAATLINQAEHMQRGIDARSALTSMQSTPGTPVQDPVTAVDDSGLPNPQVPTGPKVAGATDFLQSSPFPAVSNAAKALQSRIDAGTITADRADAYIKNLTTMHQAEQGRIDADARKMGNNIDLKVMFPPGRAGSGGGAAPTSGDFDKTGKEFLASVPPAMQNTVKAIAEGRQSLNSLSTKGGHREAIANMVNQYDPTWDQGIAPARFATRKDFTSGVAARNVTSINTAIGHMGTLGELQAALKNGDVNIINKVVNRIKDETGNPSINNAQLAAQAVGEELVRTFRATGASEREASEFQQKFSSARSPEAMIGAVKTGADLLRSRIEALDDQWKRGMRTDEGYPDLLSPKSQAVMQKFGISFGKNRRASDKPGAVIDFNSLPK